MKAGSSSAGQVAYPRARGCLPWPDTVAGKPQQPVHLVLPAKPARPARANAASAASRRLPAKLD